MLLFIFLVICVAVATIGPIMLGTVQVQAYTKKMVPALRAYSLRGMTKLHCSAIVQTLPKPAEKVYPLM